MTIDFSRTWLYHITHIQNLPKILEFGGLWSDTELELQGFCPINISYDEIKERRKKTLVPAEGRVVADYVPFYFCSRSPMLSAIHAGKIKGYSGGQRQVLHLCARLSDVLSSCKWCASDGHAVMALSNFFNSKEDLHDFDWEAIRTNQWGFPSFTQDSDLKRRKQAEFLVHNFFPWKLFIGIGVIDDDMKKQVEKILYSSIEHRPQIKIKPDWYY